MGYICAQSGPLPAAAIFSNGVLVTLLTMYGVLEAAIAPLKVPISASGCRRLWVAEGETKIGNAIFVPRISVAVWMGPAPSTRLGTRSTQSKACRLRRSVNSPSVPYAMLS